MIIIFLSVILIYLIDTFLVGITFYSLKNRFQWHISNRMTLLVLFLIFAFLENYILPLLIVLDVSFTVGNSEIAELFDLKFNEPALELFGFGLYEIITCLIQSVLAALIGEKIIMKKLKKTLFNNLLQGTAHKTAPPLSSALGPNIDIHVKSRSFKI
jgi:hypothetical protein